jgi:O-antigen/teichoic acid export membrane protein
MVGSNEQETHRTSGIRSFIHSTGTVIAGTVTQSLAFILLARSLGTLQMGALATITATSSIIMAYTGLGATELVRRRLARDPKQYPAVLGHTLIMTFGLGGMSWLLCSAAISRFVVVSAVPALNLSIIALLVLANSLLFYWVGLAEQILLAHKQTTKANAVNAGFGAARLAFTVIACAVAGITSIGAWSLWNVACSLAAAAFCAIMIAPYGRPNAAIMKDETPLGFSLSTSLLLHVVRLGADVLVLSFVAPAAVVGVYSVSRRVISTASVAAMNLDRLIYGKLAQAGSRGARGLLRQGLHYAGYAGALGLATSVVLLLTARWLPIVFGEKFGDTVPILKWMAWIVPIMGIQAVAFDCLSAADLHHLRLKIVGIGGGFGVALIVGAGVCFGLHGVICGVYGAESVLTAALWATLAWKAQFEPYQANSTTDAQAA